MRTRILRGPQLTAREVTKIRELLAMGIRQADIAARFNIVQAAVSKIKNEKAWKNR